MDIILQTIQDIIIRKKKFVTEKDITDVINEMRSKLRELNIPQHACSIDCPSNCNFTVDFNYNNTCTLGSSILGAFLPEISRIFFSNKLFNNAKYDNITIKRVNKVNNIDKTKIDNLRDNLKNYVLYILKKKGNNRRDFEQYLNNNDIVKLIDDRGNSILNNLDLVDNAMVFFLFSLINQSNDIFKLKIKMDTTENIKSGTFNIYSDHELIINNPTNEYLSEGEMKLTTNGKQLNIDWKQGFNTIINRICYHYDAVPSAVTCHIGNNYIIPSPFFIYPHLHLKHTYDNGNDNIINSTGFGINVVSALRKLDKLYYMENILKEYQQIYFGYFINKFMHKDFNDNIVTTLLDNEKSVNYVPKVNQTFIEHCRKNIRIYADNLEYLVIRNRPCHNVASTPYYFENNNLIEFNKLPKINLKNSRYINILDEHGNILNYKLESIMMGVDIGSVCQGEMYHEESGHSVLYMSCGEQWYLIDDQYNDISKRIKKVIIDKEEFKAEDNTIPKDVSGAEWSINKRDSTFMYGFNSIFTIDIKPGNTLNNIEINEIKNIFNSNTETHGWWNEGKMKNNNYIFVMIKHDGNVIGTCGIDLNELELSDDSIHKDYRGMNLYQSLLKKRVEYVKTNYNNKKFYLFTEIDSIEQLHSYTGMTKITGKKTGNFVGNNEQKYYLGGKSYHTFII